MTDINHSTGNDTGSGPSRQAAAASDRLADLTNALVDEPSTNSFVESSYPAKRLLVGKQIAYALLALVSGSFLMVVVLAFLTRPPIALLGTAVPAGRGEVAQHDLAEEQAGSNVDLHGITDSDKEIYASLLQVWFAEIRSLLSMFLQSLLPVLASVLGYMFGARQVNSTDDGGGVES